MNDIAVLLLEMLRDDITAVYSITQLNYLLQILKEILIRLLFW